MVRPSTLKLGKNVFKILKDNKYYKYLDVACHGDQSNQRTIVKTIDLIKNSSKEWPPSRLENRIVGSCLF